MTFVADYPGLELENYLSEDLDNTTIELMGGEVYITFEEDDSKGIEKLLLLFDTKSKK